MKEPPYDPPPDAGSGSHVGPAIEVHRADGMIVTRHDAIDSASGRSGYCYAYARYEIAITGVTYRARRYADTWSEVAIFPPQDEVWPAVPYGDARFARVARYFFALADVTDVTALAYGYEPVDRARLRPT